MVAESITPRNQTSAITFAGAIPRVWLVLLLAVVLLIAGAFFVTLLSMNGKLAALGEMTDKLTKMDAKLSHTNELLVATNQKLATTNERLAISVKSGESGNQRLAQTNQELQATNAGIADMRRTLAAVNAEITDLTNSIKHSHLLKI